MPGKFNPGGSPGKLHRELGVPAGTRIPAARLAAAEHSSNATIRRDAIRAKTMEGWRHGPGKHETAKMLYPTAKG
jgi:hypothetical protein